MKIFVQKREIESFFRDVKWCFNAPWGLEGWGRFLSIAPKQTKAGPLNSGTPVLVCNNFITSLFTYIYICQYCFKSLSAQSWQYRDWRKPKAGTVPYSYFEWLQGFFIVHSTIGSTVHSLPLNSLEHCICTTTMTNIRPDRDLNLVPPGYKPQSIRMSHRGRPVYLYSPFMFPPVIH